MSDTKITLEELQHIAKLAHLIISHDQQAKFLPQIESILEYFEVLNKLNTNDVEPTYQVTGLTNVWRDDVVDHDRMFTQQQALSNSKRQYNGYFVTNPTIKK